MPNPRNECGRVGLEYYTNPEYIHPSWPRDIVKESENLSGKNNEGSEMKSETNIMGKEINDFSATIFVWWLI